MYGGEVGDRDEPDDPSVCSRHTMPTLSTPTHQSAVCHHHQPHVLGATPLKYIRKYNTYKYATSFIVISYGTLSIQAIFDMRPLLNYYSFEHGYVLD